MRGTPATTEATARHTLKTSPKMSSAILGGLSGPPETTSPHSRTPSSSRQGCPFFPGIPVRRSRRGSPAALHSSRPEEEPCLRQACQSALSTHGLHRHTDRHVPILEVNTPPSLFEIMVSSSLIQVLSLALGRTAILQPPSGVPDYGQPQDLASDLRPLLPSWCPWCLPGLGFPLFLCWVLCHPWHSVQVKGLSKVCEVS